MTEVLLKYGLAGVFILVLLFAIKQMYVDNRNEIKRLHEEHTKEREISEANVLNQFRKLFDEMREDKHDTKEITKNYSTDLKNVSKVLEGFKTILESRDKK